MATNPFFLFQFLVLASNEATNSSAPVIAPPFFLNPGELVEFIADLQSFLVDLSHIIHVCQEREAAVP